MKDTTIPSHYQNRYREVFMQGARKSQAGVKYDVNLRRLEKITIGEDGCRQYEYDIQNKR
jgi:hypothetical protein